MWPSALKIGAVAAIIAAAFYFSEHTPASLPPVADPGPAARAIPDGSEAAQETGAAASPEWASFDPGEFRLSEVGPEPTEAVASDATDESEAEQRVLMVRRGDTLLDLLLNAGIARAEAHEAISALRSVYNPRNLRPGQEITLTLAASGDTPALIGASFNAAAALDISLSRDEDGRFTALKNHKALTRELVRARSTIRSSLFEAGSAVGVPGTIMVELIRAFSYDVDFQRDIQPDDAFEIVFERFRDENGRFAKDGAIVFGALTLSGATKAIYRYTARDGSTDYYNAKGESIRKALLRTPIDGARLTSGFGSRLHPILGYTAMHKGVDFAAPPGTPIQAAGDGVVEVAGWNGAYGNYVRIRHNSEYATAYAHMSRIARLRAGDRVQQGQIIGYVGSTGRSTGPHLHYEVIRRGTQVNPVNVVFPTGRKLDGQDLVQFRIAKAEMDLQVAAIEPAARLSRLSAAPGPGGAAVR